MLHSQELVVAVAVAAAVVVVFVNTCQADKSILVEILMINYLALLDLCEKTQNRNEPFNSDASTIHHPTLPLLNTPDVRN